MDEVIERMKSYVNLYYVSLTVFRCVIMQRSFATITVPNV